MSPSSRKTASLAFTVALLALVVCLDLVTGDEVSVFPIYFIPLIWAAWFLGLSPGLWLSVVAMFARRWADHVELPHHYSQPWIFWEVGLGNLAIFALFVFSFHTFKRGRKVDRDRIQQLEELVRVCPACRRLSQPDGTRKNLDQCLAELPATPPEHRLCPECADARGHIDSPL